MAIDRLDRDLKAESCRVKSNRFEMQKRLSRLNQLKSRLFPLIKRTQDLENLGTVDLNDSRVHMEILNQYEMTTYWLNHVKSKAIHRTTTENSVMDQIIKCTNLTCIPSVWIGLFNYDIFVPGFGKGDDRKNGNFSPQGMAIEVNGPVHDREGKQVKDELKSELLRVLGIQQFVINNDECREKTVKNIIGNLANKNFHLDFRAKKRVWMRVHLATISTNLDDLEWEKFLRLIFKADYKKSETKSKNEAYK